MLDWQGGRRRGGGGGGEEEEVPILLLSGGGAWQWCISQCSHDSAFNGWYPFHVLHVSPPVQAAAYVWVLSWQPRGPPPAEYSDV